MKLNEWLPNKNTCMLMAVILLLEVVYRILKH